MKRRLLILESVLEKKVHPRDLHALAKRVARRAPDIDVIVTGRHLGDHLKLFPHVFRPTLTVAFGWLRNRRFLTGDILDCPRIAKPNELERLRAAGVPVPDWVVLTPGTALDPAFWGPYVVVKPTDSSAGREVRIRRTGRVRYAPPESFPEDHPIRNGPLMAQRFIYTGPWAVSFRVCTFFGRALYCLRAEQSHEKRRLESRFEFSGAGGGVQIIAPSKTSTYTLVDDREVIELAERAHQLAFPDYPYLGFDMLRDAESGRVSVLEVNSGGAVWHLSSRGGIRLQRKHRINLYSQFDALEIAAERLVEVTRRRAMVAPMGRTSSVWADLPPGMRMLSGADTQLGG
jgi:hypothetical protein